MKTKTLSALEKVASWLRVWCTLWSPAVMYALMVWALFSIVIFDGSEVLYKGIIEGTHVSVVSTARSWDWWHRVLLGVTGACFWSYLRATFPRWFKTIRRLNYNRVSRIG